MEDFFKSLYYSIDERLERTYRKLWRTKKYKNLILQKSNAYDNLYEKLDKDCQKKFEEYVNTLNELKEEEKYHIYLTGLLDGVLLDDYFKKS